MKNTTVWGLVAGAATATAILLTYKRKDGSRLTDGIKDSARHFGDRLANFGTQIKNQLLHNVQGPNGEAVYLDMYDRQFYEDPEGKRIYLDIQ